MKNKTTVAIVGGATLLGRELQELISDEKLPWSVRQFSGESEGAGTIAAAGPSLVSAADDALSYLEPLSAGSLEDAALVFLAGAPDACSKGASLAPKHACLVDLSGSAGEGFAVAAPAIGVDSEGDRLAIAHPAAIAISLLLTKLKYVASAVVTVLEPASERGHAGIGELQKQTSNLLTFQSLPKDVYDAQVAFNVLSEYGEDAPLALGAIEDRIDRDLRTLSPAAKVSLRLIQAPVFHGYNVLAFVRMAGEVDDLSKLLQGDPLIDLRIGGTEAPSNVGASQQDGFLIGSLKRDRRDPQCWWIWMSFDNLRVSASNALAAAKQIL
jgi:aspartate-semialdehyde dehydrogenase